MSKKIIQVIVVFYLAGCASSPELSSLWVPGDFAESERQMRAALQNAKGDEAIVLRTQIARTWTFRKDFDRARYELGQIEPALDLAGPKARARYWLELGRTYASHQHRTKQQTDESKALARRAYQNALMIAQAAHLDDLAVDALHMFAFIDTAPADQLDWTQQALEAALASDQPDARRWEASLRSNLGEAFFDLKRYTKALEQFRLALTLKYEQGLSPAAIRDAKWHVARTLRLMGENDEAFAIQKVIADEAYADDQQRPYIHDELSLLYAALNDVERSRHFAEHRDALTQ